MTWPQSEPRYFGKFVSEAEAQHWIADHSWLERQVEPVEKNRVIPPELVAETAATAEN
jgi:hypothetical protein